MQIAGWKFGCHSPHSPSEHQGKFRVPKGTFDKKIKNIGVSRLVFAYLLTATLALVSLSCGVCARPFISSISPTSTIMGGNRFLLTVNGNDFRRDSLVVWNGSFLTTGVVSSHQLIAVVPATDIAVQGSVLVFVFNPSDGNATSVSGALGGNIFVNGCAARDSNAVAFTINP